VPAAANAPSFDNLRLWAGSQSRAFEELTFQLLRDSVPDGAVAVRTGNPDGGVEWYAALADGSEVGWQAKHIRKFDDLLTAMSESVRRVARERPNLTTLTFVISQNLSTGTEAGKRKSQREKYDDRIVSWQKSVPGADRIDFLLVQESDLLNILALQKHRGRQWFWWGEAVFDLAWLTEFYRGQADAAGERYSPELQVDIPIQAELTALGFPREVVTRYRRLRRDVLAAAAQVSLPVKPAALRRLVGVVNKLSVDLTAACRLAVLNNPADLALVSSLAPYLERYLNAVEAVRVAEADEDRRRAEAAGLKQPLSSSGGVATSYSVGQLVRSARALSSWLQSSEVEALCRGFYFLTGVAGSGKTHLLLDATRRALASGRPAVTLFGGSFGRSDLWQSVCDQLGLPPVGRDVLLGAMDSAAEAAGPTGCRFLLLIDALNDTVPADFWQKELSVLRAAIGRYRHIGLAVSCRDTYVELVDADDARKHFVVRQHPGFAERETEAAAKYFQHFGLDTPRVPLLVPEFTVPLFLRMYCESLHEQGLQVPDGHEGRVKVFERFLTAKIRRVSRRLRPKAQSNYEMQVVEQEVRIVLDALLDEMSGVGREALSIVRAEQIVQASSSHLKIDAVATLGVLQDEGVLTREMMYLGGSEYGDGVRVVFQAFADFLLVSRRLQASSDALDDPAFKAWLQETASLGVREAAAIVLPERFAVELPDFLEATTASGRGSEGSLLRTTMRGLPHRSGRSITPRTIELLNLALRGGQSTSELYNTIFQIAPQPDNLLNGDRLHRHLAAQKMPQRDAVFGIAMYDAIWEPSGPTARLARWASEGPYPTTDAHVIELAAIPLIWLLSSPNRFMRDWITKALVQLLQGHIDVLHKLVKRFWPVDDPYVVQRVIAIAYASLIRADESQVGDARKTARTIRKLVFSRPVRADELLLDAGRGVIELAVAREWLPKSAQLDATRPYGITPPGNPPSEAVLKRKYGYVQGRPADESYSRIYSSILGLGDFGRYVVESGVHNFSCYQLGEALPEPERMSHPRLSQPRWRKFLASLSEDQREVVDRHLSADGSPSLIQLRFGADRGSLTSDQLAQLSDCWIRPRGRPRRDEYPADRARRWVFRRALQFGWTPKLFGNADRSIDYRQGRESHKAERWGKKYQWLAYHELLARIADNYRPSRYFGDSGTFDGLHQIIGEREIDPTLPPAPYHSLFGDDDYGPVSKSTWSPSGLRLAEWPIARLDFDRYEGDLDRFIADRQSEPSLSKNCMVASADGAQWVVLEADMPQVEPDAHKGWIGLRQLFSLDSVLVPEDEAAAFLKRLPGLKDRVTHDLLDLHGHTDCCYFGEIGWSRRTCSHRHAEFSSLDDGDQTWPTVSPYERYVWEGNIQDCSIQQAAIANAPSTFVQSRTSLAMHDDGPTWTDRAGVIAITNLGDEDDDRRGALVVRASWLKDFLATNRLQLIFMMWHERMRLRDDHRYERDPVEEVHSYGRLDQDLKLVVTTPQRTTYPRSAR